MTASYLTAPYLTASYLTASYLTASYLTAPYITAPYLTACAVYAKLLCTLHVSASVQKCAYADSQGSKVRKGEIPCTVQTFKSDTNITIHSWELLHPRRRGR